MRPTINREPASLAFSLLAFVLGAFLRECSAVAVTGVSAGVNKATNERPFRQEINSFSQSGPAFDLYIQALQIFQNQSGNLGYFDISGIHGYPTNTWDGASPLPGSDTGSGYCTHSSNLFPNWHRPYLALFEQAIWNIVNNIASIYPSNQVQNYKAVVNGWRIPYWDWADARNPGIPSVLSSPRISINTPSGKRTVTNPLYSYRFPKYPRNIPNMGGDSFMDDWLFTVRHPTTGESSGGKGKQDDNAANSAVLDSSASLHQMTYQLLSDTSESFNNFATDANKALSVEQIHDQIHTIVGGDGGHMSYIPWAAFDPIFWLHHTNVDRLFAIWQAINQNTYITPEMNPATYASPAAEGTADSPLYPFHSTSDNANFHTPASTRSTSAFGYTYPEVVDWNTTAADLRTTVIAEVNKLYNSGASTNGGNNSSTTQPHHRRDIPDKSSTLTLSPSDLLAYQINNLPNQYSLNVTLPLQPQSLTLYFFLGAPPASTSDILSSSPPPSNLLATHSVFSATSANMRVAGQGITIYALVPITASLYALVLQGTIPNLDLNGAVGPFLQKQGITWTVTTGSGSGSSSSSSLEGLQVEVLHRDVTPTTHETEFPSYGAWTVCEACGEGLGKSGNRTTTV